MLALVPVLFPVVPVVEEPMLLPESLPAAYSDEGISPPLAPAVRRSSKLSRRKIWAILLALVGGLVSGSIDSCCCLIINLNLF